MSYHEHWASPELGCNASIVRHDHAAGNTPGMIPLDTSVLNDLDEAINRHAARTSRLPCADPKKFSLPTPTRASSAFRRAWTGDPVSKRHKQDTGKLACSVQQIVNNEGCVVPSLGNSGKRHDSEGKKSLNWGGKRIRSATVEKECWIHDDAKECPEVMIKETVLKVEK